MKVKVLLVEDEHTLAGIIADTLDEKGFDVCIAHNGVKGMEMFNEKRPDIIVTDIMMPQMDGFSFVKEIRKTEKDIPIIFLTARSDVDDIVEGFDIGANDYLKKPFAMRELIVRIKALLGRLNKTKEQTIFQIGKFTFDSGNWTLNITLKEDNIDSKILSKRESDVLFFLCKNMGEIVPNSLILKKLWGDDTYFNARSLHVFITKLRHKLSYDSSLSIVNVRGVGYMIKIMESVSTSLKNIQ